MKPIRDIRRERLEQLVAKHGGQSAVAEKIGKDRNQIHQWLLPPENRNGRNIGDVSARIIEKSFGLAAGWLDAQTALPSPQAAHPLADYCPPARYVADLIEGIQDSDLQMHAFIEAVRVIESLTKPHNSDESQRVSAPTPARHPQK